MSRRIVIAGVASGLACLVPLTALAQAAAAAASPAASTPSGEIARVVITAQKRKEDIRDVPLSVSVLSGEQLQAQQITTVEDLTRNIPNVSFSSQGGPGLGTVEIRGVSSQAGAATVSVYLDDVSLTTRNLYSQGTAEPRFFDLQDAEVLRGPQGTLYGASALGGTIKFISRQPDLKTFSGSTTETVSWTQKGGANYEAQGILNVPLISNQLGLRIGIEHGHESGYVDQVDSNGQKIAKNINHDDYTVIKLAMKADLGGGWSVTPALFQQQTNTGDIDATYSSLPRYETSKTVREPGHDLLSVPSLTVNGDTGIGNFTGVLSGYKRRFNRIQDGTSINDPSYAVINPNANNADPTPPANVTALINALNGLSSQVQLNNKIDQTALELRMASKDYDPKGGSPLTWIGGLYLQDAVTSVYDNEPIPGVLAAFAANGVDPADPNAFGGFPGEFANDDSYYSVRHYHDRQASVFGEATYHVSPALAFTAGLRELRATQKFTRAALPLFYDGAAPVTPGYGAYAPIDAKWSATTPSFKMNWEVTPEASIYANVSKGFRLGGANRPVPDTPIVDANLAKLGLPSHGVPTSYAPDSLWSYELGSKMDLADHRLTLNVAAYVLKWKNIQQDIPLADAGYDYETNVGKATSYGAEAELKARVTPELTMSTSLGFTHATFDADNPAFGLAKDNQDNIRKGDQVEGVPRASASLGADYHWALTDSVNAFVRGNAQWTGKSHGTVFRGDADYARASYFTADASAGVNFDKWEVTAFIKNANNNHVQIQHPNVQGVDEAYYLRPRTIGMTANYEF